MYAAKELGLHQTVYNPRDEVAATNQQVVQPHGRKSLNTLQSGHFRGDRSELKVQNVPTF